MRMHCGIWGRWDLRSGGIRKFAEMDETCYDQY